MKYVYLLESIDHPKESYIGLADDLRARFAAHNAGQSLIPRNSNLGGS
jgi:predicted GIY-YIG superfamily endonuclease